MFHALLEVMLFPASAASIALVASSAFNKRPDAARWTAVGVGVATATAVVASGWAVQVAAIFVLIAWLGVVGRNWADRHAQVITLAASLIVLACAGAGWALGTGAVISAFVLLGDGTFNRGGLKRKWNGVNTLPPLAPMRPVNPMPPMPAPGAVVEPTLPQLANNPRLSAPLRNRILWIEHNTTLALNELSAQSVHSAERTYTLQQIRKDYTPSAIRAYLALPADTASTKPIEGDKTGADLLADQLDRMLRAIDRIRDDNADHSAEALRASERFLADRFPDTNRDLTL